MDDLILLRTLRDHAEQPSEIAVAKGREALLQKIAEESRSDLNWQSLVNVQHVPKARTRRRTASRRFAGIGGLAAAALIGGLVITNTLGLAGWHGGADPAAASVLRDAAVTTLKTSDPVVGPAQYLRIETTGIFEAGGPDSEGNSVGYLRKTVEDIFIPADSTRDWVWQRAAPSVYQTFGAASELLSQTDSTHSEKAQVFTALNGAFSGTAPVVTSSDLAKLSRDPTQLLNHIYWITLGAGQSADGEAFVWIADTLRSGAAPADLRAALYEAAARIPGVTLTDQQATLDGHTGISIGRVEPADSTRQDILIDQNTGLVIGERKVRLTSAGGFPAGTVTGTTVTTTVSDSAP